MSEIKDTINKYLNNEISLRELEDEVIACLEVDENPILDDIISDIGFTTKGTLTEEEKQYGLITENELKNRLKKYLAEL